MKAITVQNPFEKIISVVLDSLQSEASRRVYRMALRDFMAWYQKSGEQRLSKAVVREYIQHLREIGTGPSSINLRLAAITKMVNEAADNGALPAGDAAAIARIQRLKCENTRQGRWLSLDQAQAALNSPDARTLRGKRDRAVLAVLLGAGLRRAEVTELRFSDVRMVSARWVIDVINGKGGKSRTVPIPSWTKQAIDEWAQAALISEGFIFRSIRRGNHLAGDSLAGDSMSTQAIRDILVKYEIPAAPHDLRRTSAQLAHLGGSPIEQIRISLGHSSLVTTMRYLGIRQNLVDAPADHLGLSL